MRVKYEEGTDALTVPGCGVVPRGEAIEVSDELGASLIEQGWVEDGKPAQKKTEKPSVEPVDKPNKESI